MYIKDSEIRGLVHHVRWEDVQYITTKGNHLLIWKRGAIYPIESYTSLNRLIEKYPPPDNFIRTHSQYLINENDIEKILFEGRGKSGRVWMNGVQCALISRDSDFYKRLFYTPRGKRSLPVLPLEPSENGLKDNIE